MKANISDILITKRIRKEVTKIEELAEDIEKHGLLNPITVMSENGGKFRLLAGLRRLKAVCFLDWDEIDINVVSPADAEAALLIEISENEQREPFTYSEKMDFARLLEDIEAAKAKQRMVEGGVIAGRGRSLEGKKGMAVRPYPIGGGNKNEMLDEESVQSPTFTGTSRDAIGKKIGMSGRTYERAKFIHENASDDVIDRLDKEETSIYKEYNTLRAQTKNVDDVENAAHKDSLPDCVPHNAGEPNVAVIEESHNGSEDINGTGNIENNNSETLNTQTIADESKHLPSASRLPKPLSEADEEAQRKIIEFNVMPPNKKIEVLQEQLRKERARAAEAESELKREKELHHNTSYHSKLSIANLEKQIAGLEAKVLELTELLAKANSR